MKNPDLDPAPVNLTELRKAGLARACKLTGIADPSPVVESCFEVWRRARHDVEHHLFPGVLDTLKQLKERGVRCVGAGYVFAFVCEKRCRQFSDLGQVFLKECSEEWRGREREKRCPQLGVRGATPFVPSVLVLVLAGGSENK